MKRIIAEQKKLELFQLIRDERKTLYGEFKGPNARSRRLQEWGRIRERAIQLGLINDATSTRSMLQGVIKNTQDRTKKKFQQKNQSGPGAVVWTELDDTVMDCLGRDNYLTSFEVPGGITWGQLTTNQQEAVPETALTTAVETSPAPSIYFTAEDVRVIGLGTPLAQAPATNAAPLTSTVPSTSAGPSNATVPSAGPSQGSATALSTGEASSADAALSTGAAQASERNRDEIEARLQLIRSTPLFRRTPEEVTLLRTYLSLQILEDMLQEGTPRATLAYVL
ncbi:uncharacterized protein LOC122381425 [Amphibalanus amphitrite]|uniref:uncharacterized protein LOC122381425 n=1 Tax=Amphibalanus amphitrite TaxID=1232801 RepID=UPI001C928170|nr:uncharacterized protein LOC122381425 [Amphibalanus amphitrite]